MLVADLQIDKVGLSISAVKLPSYEPFRFQRAAAKHASGYNFAQSFRLALSRSRARSAVYVAHNSRPISHQSDALLLHVLQSSKCLCAAERASFASGVRYHSLKDVLTRHDREVSVQ